MTVKKPALFTIGYEQTPAMAVLKQLKAAKVELLVDVRAVAASRRPGFSKRQLAAALDEQGIGYLHLRSLGTPKEGRLAARSGDLASLWRIYDKHLKTSDAREAMDELVAIVKSGRRVCLLCYERDVNQCHRKRVAQLVEDRKKLQVENLVTPLM